MSKVVNTLRRKNGTKSCGCLSKEVTTKRNTSHGMGKTRPYRIWCHLTESTIIKDTVKKIADGLLKKNRE